MFSHLSRNLCVRARAVTTSAQRKVSTGWAKQDARRPLHAVVKVKDLDRQVEYYQKHFGMKLLEHNTDKKSARLGYGPQQTNFAIEVQQIANDLDIGTGFGHFGIVLPDVYAAVDKIKQEGGKVTREAGPVKGGNTVIAFVEDPSGYKWELLQRGETPEPLCQVMLRVGDLQRSIDWYSHVLGMQLVRQRDNPEYKYTLGFMGYGPEESSAVVELTYNYGVKSYVHGTAYAHMAISTKDVFKTAQAIRAAGGKLVQEPGPLGGMGGPKACVVEDPDGWRFVLVDNHDFLTKIQK